jgi:geranylgeranyl diphosphate synthase type I
MNNFDSKLIGSLVEHINKDIQSLINDICPTHIPLFTEMIDWHFGWKKNGNGQMQGKRLRPLLLLLLCQATGGDFLHALPAATAVELIHNFTLIHDDIQDSSTTRHNRAALWFKYGIPQAINTGDALFSLAKISLDRMQKSYQCETILKVSNLLDHTVFKLTTGQFLDMFFESSTKITLEDYFEMLKGKTGALISTSCMIGAILGNSDPEIIVKAGEFGLNLGLAFQIQDDYLGIWGDQAITGKSNTNDLNTRKLTLPIIYGVQNRGRFAAIWKSQVSSPQVLAELTNLLELEGAKSFTLNTAKEYSQKAMNILPGIFTIQDEFTSLLINLAQDLVSREN